MFVFCGCCSILQGSQTAAASSAVAAAVYDPDHEPEHALKLLLLHHVQLMQQQQLVTPSRPGAWCLWGPRPRPDSVRPQLQHLAPATHPFLHAFCYISCCIPLRMQREECISYSFQHPPFCLHLLYLPLHPTPFYTTSWSPLWSTPGHAGSMMP